MRAISSAELRNAASHPIIAEALLSAKKRELLADMLAAVLFGAFSAGFYLWIKTF